MLKYPARLGGRTIGWWLLYRGDIARLLPAAIIERGMLRAGRLALSRR
jgi:hypothetical protein